jgi:Tol biopolymer transport system component
MKRFMLVAVTATALLMPMRPAAQERTDVALRAAMETETVKGDLHAAIDQYRKLAAQTRDRAIAATALVRMAECYQKLGDAQARSIYEQIARDYTDQKDAVAIARARLGTRGTAVASAKGDRAVWTGRDVDLFGTVSPDGRFLTYVDWGGFTNVMIRDLVAGTSRPITNNTKPSEFGFGQWSAISRDGSQVAYEWNGLDSVDELRVAGLGAAATSSTRIVKRFQPGESIRPFEWSPDGRLLAVLIERTDRSSQIGTLSVQDGTLRLLKSINWRGVNKMVFSPDGRFIAYEMMPGDARDRTHIYVMAIDASRESAVVDDASKNYVMGWSPDGYVVFGSDRTGTTALWTVRVEDGRATEPPALVKEHIGSTFSLGLTPSGTLYVFQNASAPYVKVAAFDPDSGKLMNGGAAEFHRFIESRGRPQWSADGKHLLYESCSSGGGGPCALFDRSSETGAVREIPHGLGYLGFPQFSPDGSMIAASGTDLKGRHGMYLIEAATGKTTLIERPDSTGTNPEWSPDGRSLRYMATLGEETVVLEQEVGSLQPREIFRTATRRAFVRLSPDGRLAAFLRYDPGGKTTDVVISPVSSGTPRVVFKADGPNSVDPVWQWTSDSRAVVLRAQRAEGGELWRVGLTGAPQKLAIDVRQWREGFSIHPDGRHIAFVAQAGAPGAEVWALENFLPAPSAKKP